MDILLTGIAFLLGVFVPHWLIGWDERRLGPQRLARAWNPASHWAAVLGFSFLCIPVHFGRTRRTLLGVVLGVGWMLLSMLLTSLLLEGLGWLFGVV